MNRHIKFRHDSGFQPIVSPGTMRFLDFARLELSKGEKHTGETGSRELVVDIFAGWAKVKIESHGGDYATYESAGAREDVFSGPPAMVYVPINSKFSIEAISEKFDAGLFTAPAKTVSPPRLLAGADVVTKQVGRDNWQRTVYSALDERTNVERLLAGETLNPPGNWSSYPPHKHDQNNPPNEAVLEEIYFFRAKPALGYGFIWTYTNPTDTEGFSTVFVVEDGDTVLLPKGYHPVVAAPGYQLHYTWVLAGEERRYGAWADDPRHAWVKKP
jgi:5-deoxy-glucuronate isomerase